MSPAFSDRKAEVEHNELLSHEHGFASSGTEHIPTVESIRTKYQQVIDRLKHRRKIRLMVKFK